MVAIKKAAVFIRSVSSVVSSAGNVTVKTTALQSDIKAALAADRQIHEVAKKVAADTKFAKRIIDAANKRLKRLEQSAHKTSDFVQKKLSEGKFSTRGKSDAEKRRELARALQFMNAESSTITGANKVVAQAASRLGMSYNSIEEAVQGVKNTWALINKAQEYLKTVADAGSAFTSSETQDVITQYVQAAGGAFENLENGLPDVIEALLDAQKRETTVINLPQGQTIMAKDIFK